MPDECESCTHEVPHSQAHDARIALAHVTPAQRIQFVALFGGDAPPELLCAKCFIAALSMVNTAVLAKRKSASNEGLT